LYTFGKLDAAAHAAQQNLGAAHARLDAARADVVFNARRGYYALKLAREQLSTTTESRTKLQTALGRVRPVPAGDAGSSASIERSRLEVAEAFLEARYLDALKAERLARAGLAALLPAAGEFDVDAEPLRPLPVPLAPFEVFREAARAQRPEARLVRFGLAAVGDNLRLARANLFPDILLVGSIAGLSRTTENDDPLSPYMLHPYAPYGYGGGLFVRAGLELHLLLPRLDRARAELSAGRALVQAFYDLQGMDLLSVWESIEEAHRKVELGVDGERAARAWLERAASGFKGGLAEAREFNDALVSYLDAHGRYQQAIYDLDVAIAWLERLSGGPPAAAPTGQPPG
jgi:outer membrane protein TolC